MAIALAEFIGGVLANLGKAKDTGYLCHDETDEESNDGGDGKGSEGPFQTARFFIR